MDHLLNAMHAIGGTDYLTHPNGDPTPKSRASNELLIALREVITNGHYVNGEWAISGDVYAMAQDAIAKADGN